MDLIKSYSQKNSVKVIAFAMFFVQRLSTKEIAQIVSSIKESAYFVDNFTEIKEQHEIAMTINEEGIPSHSRSVGGVICQKKNAKNSLLWDIEINKDMIVLRCTHYTRWKQVSEKFYQYITEIFKIDLIHDSKVINLTLEYLDEFLILDEASDWKAELFQEESKYLIKNAYEVNDFWHINTGYFKELELETSSIKLLDNVNINYYADEEDDLKRKVNIKMQHKVISKEDISCNEDSSKIEKVFNAIHIHSKEIFEDIINKKIKDEFEQGVSDA